MSKIRVVLADDHPVILAGVKALVEQSANISVIGMAHDPLSLFSLLKHVECDVLVTDFSMPSKTEVDGLAMIRQVRKQFPAVVVVVLTVLKNAPLYRELLGAGVSGILHKDSESMEIVKAVTQVYNGLVFLGRSSAELLEERQLTTAGSVDSKQVLSPRELEILRFLARGATANEIAGQIHRSVKTISHHKRSAMEKLKVDTDVQLMRYIAENGLDESDN
ncbi:response regulator transcription factor [Collimonas sp.]|jgi:two-component system capsular synthesis response regulator RcsB|uniref:response regulator transcription factor n=1 Tax=Collimonas sp. TaxID=1963772 RepID=UPI002C450655|nr:response regulator transcription factor [Collimonas sp.]HWW08371.1 response regulator transcription factor [Collimonas sp.]